MKNFSIKINGDEHAVSFDGFETLYSVNKQIIWSDVHLTPNDNERRFNRFVAKLERLSKV